jgi:hypothetical protein
VPFFFSGFRPSGKTEKKKKKGVFVDLAFTLTFFALSCFVRENGKKKQGNSVLQATESKANDLGGLVADPSVAPGAEHVPP